MHSLWQVLYDALVIPLLWVFLRGAGLVSAKVRRGIAARNGLFASLERNVAALPPGPRIWFHASSMGEFEQAKPIIARLKELRPDVRVIASFFSPSGYDNSLRYPHADVKTYLPFDTRRGARRFLDILRPDIAVMVRYDVWPNHVWELRRRRTLCMIANATMRSTTPRHLPVARTFHHALYGAFTHILTVTTADAEAFRAFGLAAEAVTAVGDTRYDQVMQRSAGARQKSIIAPHVTAGKRVLVAGSTWPEDEQALLPAFLRLHAADERRLLVLVPHEPTERHLEEVEAQLLGRIRSIRFSSLQAYDGEPVILVDSIGVLMSLYAAAHAAYVGGSFRQGVHNVLEAAVYGIPVLFGPRYRNSREPLELVHEGGAFVVTGAEDLERSLSNLLGDEAARTAAGEKALRFVRSRVGATDRVLERIIAGLPLA
jgi:3-deoxy-D-manno-octulosonic-acid transferase